MKVCPRVNNKVTGRTTSCQRRWRSIHPSMTQNRHFERRKEENSFCSWRRSTSMGGSCTKMESKFTFRGQHPGQTERKSSFTTVQRETQLEPACSSVESSSYYFLVSPNFFSGLLSVAAVVITSSSLMMIQLLPVSNRWSLHFSFLSSFLQWAGKRALIEERRGWKEATAFQFSRR